MVVSAFTEWALPVFVVDLGCFAVTAGPLAVGVALEVHCACALPCRVVTAGVG